MHTCPDCGASHKERPKSDKERIKELELEVESLKAKLLDTLMYKAPVHVCPTYVPCYRPHLPSYPYGTWSNNTGDYFPNTTQIRLTNTRI